MTAEQFRGILKRLNWSMADASRYLEVPYRTIQAWADGGEFHRDPSPMAVLLLDLAMHVPEARRWIMAEGGPVGLVTLDTIRSWGPDAA